MRLFVCGWVIEWVRESIALCLVGTIQTTILDRLHSNFTCKLCMMRRGTPLILGHRVKGRGRVWYSMYKTLWAQYRLQF